MSAPYKKVILFGATSGTSFCKTVAHRQGLVLRLLRSMLRRELVLLLLDVDRNSSMNSQISTRARFPQRCLISRNWTRSLYLWRKSLPTTLTLNAYFSTGETNFC